MKAKNKSIRGKRTRELQVHWKESGLCIYLKWCLLSIHVRNALKSQHTTYIQCIWSQISGDKCFQCYLKYWHSTGKCCKCKQKESIWNHSKSELHFRGSIWAGYHQQLKGFFLTHWLWLHFKQIILFISAKISVTKWLA